MGMKIDLLCVKYLTCMYFVIFESLHNIIIKNSFAVSKHK